MMKSVARFSVLAAFAALMCFAPCAFAQGLAGGTAAGASVLNSAPPAFLIFGGPGGNQLGGQFGGIGGFGGWGGNGGNGGCGNQGWGGWGDKGGCGGGGSKSVPEGGTSLMYLAFSSLFCVGAVVYRSRRQTSVR
ncbi:MAG: hypothetical protein WCC99_12150 [Candidatus Sulfotelmatobacter sp.]